MAVSTETVAALAANATVQKKSEMAFLGFMALYPMLQADIIPFSGDEIKRNQRKEIREKEKFLNDYEFITTEGMTYKFYKIDTFGNAEAVILSKPQVDTKCSHYRMATLDKENKNLRYIRDDIFKDYTKIIRARKIAIIFMIIAYTIAAIAGLCIYLLQNQFTFFILSIVLAAVLFVVGTTLLVLTLSWSGEINRKRRKMGAV